MSSFSSTDGQSKSNNAGISETRSIDYIPENERHGHPFSQFTLWFGGNLQITAIVTGALAVVLVDAASVGLGGGLGRLPAGRASHQPSARQAMTSSNHTPRMPFSTAVA